jgi:hypothetical protein
VIFPVSAEIDDDASPAVRDRRRGVPSMEPRRCGDFSARTEKYNGHR